MYYFERGPYHIPVFWKENGLPFFIAGQRISSRKMVWWMPSNWIAIPALIILAPLTLWRQRKPRPPQRTPDP